MATKTKRVVKARGKDAKGPSHKQAAQPSGGIDGLHHLWIPTADFPRSWKFWTGVVGLKVNSQWGEGTWAAGSLGFGEAHLTVAASEEGFYRSLGYPIAYGRPQVFLKVRGIEAELKRLKKAGAKIARGLHKTHWGPRAFTVEGPDGLFVVFMED